MNGYAIMGAAMGAGLAFRGVGVEIEVGGER